MSVKVKIITLDKGLAGQIVKQQSVSKDIFDEIVSGKIKVLGWTWSRNIESKWRTTISQVLLIELKDGDLLFIPAFEVLLPYKGKQIFI